MAGISPADLQYMEEHAADDRRIAVILPCALCGVVAYSAFGLRLLARKIAKVKYGLDDLFLGFGLVCWIPF
jgi:hypothetical protein